MHPHLQTRRRVVIRAAATYGEADRAWRLALQEARELVPDVVGRGYWRIGAPESRLRRLYEARSHALDRLIVSRIKLETARARLEDRQRPRTILLLG